MPKEPEWERRELEIPRDLFDETDDTKELLTFIQMPGYTESYQRLELTDDEQRAVETGIMMNPTLAPVIEGTGGIREFEFSTPGQNAGSLHLSAFYAYFPDGKVALIDLFETDEIGEMTGPEREELKNLFEEIQEFGPEAWES